MLRVASRLVRVTRPDPTRPVRFEDFLTGPDPTGETWIGTPPGPAGLDSTREYLGNLPGPTCGVGNDL